MNTKNENIKNWKVYRHLFPNGKSYIGITNKKPEDRWGNNGRKYKEQPFIWHAIQKYGWENVEHFILYVDLTKEEACKKEQELIQYYHSYYDDPEGPGYNGTRGGEGSIHIDVYKVEKLFNSGMRATDIARQLGHCRDNITAILKGLGYNLPIGSEKKVNQFDLKGNYIQTFPSLSEAERQLGIRETSISSVLCNITKSAGGYQWKEYNEEDIIKGIGPIQRKTPGSPKQKIIQYDLDWNFIKEYESVADAAKAVNRSRGNINGALSRVNGTCAGYHWKRCD